MKCRECGKEVDEENFCKDCYKFVEDGDDYYTE